MNDSIISHEKRALERAVGSGLLLESLPIGVYCCDRRGVLQHANRRAIELWGRSAVAEQGARFDGAHRLFLPDGTTLSPDDAPMAQVLRTARPVHDMRLILERPDGSRLKIVANVEPLFEADGTFIGAVDCFQDITEHSGMEGEAAHLAAIVSSSTDAIVSKTLEGIVQSWNGGAVRIFGWQPEEIIGKPITLIVPPELHHEESNILSRLKRGERVEHFETERVTKDGHRVDISLTVSPIHDRSGRIIGASKVARDISERKRAERLQRLLISELNHRVKNTLAIVQSIANQTVRRARTPAEAVAGFSGRIQALAQTHELLTRNSWQGAEMLGLARGQLLVDSADDNRIAFSGPSLTLDPQPALHLALILHELGTNARKYGSLSVPEGRLDVSWTVRSGKDGNRLLLAWRESGGPPVEVPTERGFGTTLIERSLAAHGGEASIDYRVGGITCDIVLPVPRRTQSIPAGFSLSIPAHEPESAPEEPFVFSAGIEGKRVLVVEDEALIAMDLAVMLSESGCIVVGPASTLEEAGALVAEGGLDAALLDANLDRRPVKALVSELTHMGVPFVFLTGYEREALPESFRDHPIVTKPFTRSEVIETVARLTTRDDTVADKRPEGS